MIEQTPFSVLEKSIRDHPDVAIFVLSYLSKFAQLEMVLHTTLSQMLGDDDGVVHAFLSPWNSFSQKLTVIESIAKIRKGDPQANAIINRISDIREVNRFRNIIAHSVYIAEDDKVEAISWMLSNKLPSVTAFSPELIKAKKELIMNVMGSLLAVLKHGVDNSYRRGQT